MAQQYGDAAWDNSVGYCVRKSGQGYCMGQEIRATAKYISMGLLRGITVWDYSVRRQFGDTAHDNSMGILR